MVRAQSQTSRSGPQGERIAGGHSGTTAFLSNLVSADVVARTAKLAGSTGSITRSQAPPENALPGRLRVPCHSPGPARRHFREAEPRDRAFPDGAWERELCIRWREEVTS